MSWRRLASLGDLRAARRWLARTIDDVDVIAGNVDGAWFAVEDRCAHAGCPFSTEGDLAGTTLICNCHGSEYTLPSGEVRRGPAERGVRAFPVRVAGDDLEIDL